MKTKILIIFIIAIGISVSLAALSQENQNPEIKEIGWWQIHETYEEVPHKYGLFVEASDPDGNYPLIYHWSIDCGYFAGETASDEVEWHYNVPGECVEAKVTVVVVDSMGAETQKTRYVFSETNEVIEEIRHSPEEQSEEQPKEKPEEKFKEQPEKIIEQEILKETTEKLSEEEDIFADETEKTNENGLITAEQSEKEEIEIKNKGFFAVIIILILFAAGLILGIKFKDKAEEKTEDHGVKDKDKCFEELEKRKRYLEGLEIDYAECWREKRAKLRDLGPKINNINEKKIWNKWWNEFSWLRETFKIIFEVKKFTKLQSPKEMKGLWDWGGPFGTAVGYAAEDLTKAVVPSDLIVLVGKSYDIFAGFLNPKTWGGAERLMLSKDGLDNPERIAESFQNACITMKEALESYNNCCFPFIEIVRKLKENGLMKDFEKCVNSLPRYGFNVKVLPEDCPKTMAQIEEKIKEAEKLVKTCEQCGYEEIEAMIKKAIELKEKIEQSTQEMKQAWRDLESYRKVMREFFNK